MKTIKTYKGITSCIALCTGCGWFNEDQFTAARKASRHVRNTGHKVSVEQAVSYIVKPDVRKKR